MFVRILICALLSGAGAGLIAGVLQWFFVQPVLLHAELYETGAVVHFNTTGSSAIAPDRHFELMRDGLSLIFTMIIYFSYAMVLIPLMIILTSAKPSQLQGVLWGVLGYAALQLAPAFGLAPEVPGVAAADVTDRQIWWAATVAISALSVALMVYGKHYGLKALAVLLLLAPHIFGAPHPATFVGSAPPELAALFVARVLGVGFLSWIILGVMAVYFWNTQDE